MAHSVRVHPRALLPDEIQHIEVDGITVEVRRMARRRQTLTLQLKDGQPVLLAPSWVPDKQVREWLAGRVSWIRSRLEPPPAAVVALPERLPVDGLPRALELTAGAPRARVMLEGGSLRVAVPARPGLEAAALDALLRWYGERTRRAVELRLAARSVEMGWTPARITIRNQQRRWGSHTSRGALHFNLRLSMLSPELLDYVVVHELAHHFRRDHSPHFWAVVAKVLPHYLDLRRQLRSAERELPLLWRAANGG